MQTWDLGRAFSDNTLEGIMVGIVYSATDVPAAAGSAPGARIKIKSRDERSAVVKEEGKGDVDMSELESGKKWRRECVEGAVKEVEGRQQMEGVMDLAEDVTGSGLILPDESIRASM
ncbi:hypothetical protein M7I_3866 [Glarea lozoyensis 74030]|uniref:Uncharacterized protein n=1 Tax=Glarea lozoyensis (strain ATCC 74030 / MF5533) TaxID=1104152 RepID=H0EMM7_GLAL7|nr:hypothetical protein M7I_3866 [Glarea lozoyensis 74030]